MPQFHYTCHNHSFGGPTELEFRGDFLRPSRAVDHRIYLPKLMAAFETRGGKIEIAAVGARELGAIAQRFDLLIAAAGRGPLANAFKPVIAWSPYDAPQRQLLAGLFSGIRPANPVGATLLSSPGHGELIDIPLPDLRRNGLGAAV